ncbi:MULTISPECIES: ATP synthase F1 subunit delta [Tenacibaculum]|uniref:ATP synthase subunit delta n=1 Tax=Tenacibaculum aiptasiae TaxID=426481 RepID=A0A7J5ANA0_9FLAO|nr:MULTISPECIES: ATP synthase F1 subunit delta [Tenacibaculum]KAB1158975.1 ATP synthase F1 subunit delta [Tenacibaculum aiptasiae]MCF2876086.1 ATP synthase F1 subunit delta [Tenacibaculum sp. Cn5-1]MCF2936161.1 ATP synthase F1 subunit delta [Tenacibaculum sp. Cn5-34]MCG7512722.1 ATP synthase F1 subunit delta [Tenacibaculum sp. Cn5-46]
MKGARPALRYAKAILNLAKETGNETLVNDNMKLIVDTIAESSELDTMLKSPVIKAADKRKVLAALFGDKVDNVIKGLFNLLEENKRMIMLEPIAKQYSIIYDYHKSMQVAKVTTAVALTKELEDKIQAKIVELTGNSASIENIVNPEILGGFILRVGDVQYDASISNQFNELRREFDNSHYIPQI